VQLLGLLQQRGPTAMAVHHLGRTAEIQVDAGRPQARQARRVLGQADRVRTHQLHPHRHPGGGAPALPELGHHAAKARSGSSVPVTRMNSDTHRSTPHPREHVAQHAVEQALHGRQKDGHDRKRIGSRKYKPAAEATALQQAGRKAPELAEA
jgi:hypothetical protein